MKYIGPFLRINKLKKENVENQLFYFAKESLRQIVLHSKCGVYTSPKELKLKNSSNFDTNTFNSLSPLLCIYKKANPKLITINNKVCWDYDKFKKEINIDSNALMTLCLLELHDYYASFKGIDENKYNLATLYNIICKKQLEFYASYFRNAEGVFVDKKDESDEYSSDLKFVEKNKKFKFSSQALLMAAYYKCSCISDGEEKNSFLNFSLDILNMFIEFKEELYALSYDELTKLCMALNIFYSYSKNEKCKILLIDLSELLSEKKDDLSSIPNEKLEYDCMEYINYTLFYNNTNLDKFKNNAKNICSDLLNLYEPEKGIFLKYTEGKEIDFSCLEVSLYLIVCIVNSHIDDDKNKNKNNMIILDVFKRQLVDSGLILSWPDAPNLNDSERYRNYSLKSEDLLEEQFFRLPSIATPENTELASIFTKYVTYNKKKETFKVSKFSFESYKNMLILFLFIYLLKPDSLDKNNI